MRVGISGAPASGKTTIADELAKELNYAVIHLTHYINEKRLARGYDKRLNARIVDVGKVERELLNELPYDVIIEGHLLVEMELPLDAMIILKEKPTTLAKRMRERRYKEEKIEENLLAVQLDYFEKVAREKYSNVIVIKPGKTPAATVKKIREELSL
ncbi:MAG: hypothetical protein D6769_03885 [Methanobacteriota archaeon]|nr:MAG: hypothetical protein D6769_03885 [Euryarchaeota archaeon]